MKRFFGTNKNKNKNAVPQLTLEDISGNMDKRMDHLDTKINRLDAQILALKRKMNLSSGNAKKNYQMKALKLLKQKKQYEQQRDRTMGQQMNIENAKFATESVADNVQMMSAMKGANAALKKQFKEINIDDVDDVMDDMGELMDETNEINEIMSEQWNGDDYDEDELLDELDGFDDELDDLDEMEEDEAPSYLTSANAAQSKPKSNPEKEIAANQMAKIQMKN